MTLLPPHGCLVLIETDGTLGWLGQFPDLATARAAMADWLKSPDREPEDAAFIIPTLGVARPQQEA